MKKYICRPDYPIVETKAGLLRGFFFDGLFHFRGVQYAQAKRWQPAEPVSPWEGVKQATNYGPTAPTYGSLVPSGEMMIPHRYWPEQETCQYLNIWTPGLDGARRPVIVWFHGGGYKDGSSLEQVAYEGDRLSSYGDAVVITVNHRLNIFGYLDMSSFDAKYANSVNAGITDLVMCLKWIQENIAGFGGDPGNVTIFGQSGGGGKVATLLQTPAAAGLFHKAVIMSGTIDFYDPDAPDHRDIVLEMLKVAGLSEDQYEELEKMPYNILMRAYNRACAHLGWGINWTPVPNDWYVGPLPHFPMTEYAKKVPTIVGTAISEFAAFRLANAPVQTDAEKAAAADEAFTGHGDEMIKAFKKAYPGKDLSALLTLDTWVRDGAIKYLDARSADGPETPAWAYVFAPVFDVNGGVPSWHCADIPFLFRNTDRVPAVNLAGVTDRLEDFLSGSLLALARYGDPNHPGLPEWKPFTADDHETMVFDVKSACLKDHDTELLRLHAEYGKVATISHPTFVSDEDEGQQWLF